MNIKKCPRRKETHTHTPIHSYQRNKNCNTTCRYCGSNFSWIKQAGTNSLLHLLLIEIKVNNPANRLSKRSSERGAETERESQFKIVEFNAAQWYQLVWFRCRQFSVFWTISHKRDLNELNIIECGLRAAQLRDCLSGIHFCCIQHNWQ